MPNFSWQVRPLTPGWLITWGVKVVLLEIKLEITPLLSAIKHSVKPAHTTINTTHKQFVIICNNSVIRKSTLRAGGCNSTYNSPVLYIVYCVIHSIYYAAAVSTYIIGCI